MGLPKPLTHENCVCVGGLDEERAFLRMRTASFSIPS